MFAHGLAPGTWSRRSSTIQMPEPINNFDRNRENRKRYRIDKHHPMVPSGLVAKLINIRLDVFVVL